MFGGMIVCDSILYYKVITKCTLYERSSPSALSRCLSKMQSPACAHRCTSSVEISRSFDDTLMCLETVGQGPLCQSLALRQLEAVGEGAR